MDILDNIIYANQTSLLLPNPPPTLIVSDYIPPTVIAPPVNIGGAVTPLYAYRLDDKMSYCAYADPTIIERSIQRHWFDLNGQVNYDSNGVAAINTPVAAGAIRYSSFEESTHYHLIYAYFLENTRILQIFQRFMERYLYDEDFGIADNSEVFNWIQNSERLFFKSDTPRTSNLRSLIRPSADASRRNAYHRLFGMDLAFGDISTNNSVEYYKSKSSNQQFIVLFEKYLSEIWQGYINARNATGANTSDINIIVDLAQELREVLIARRGNVTLNSYANLSLSREEYSSVLITSWFAFIISDDTPVVNFLNCQSSTIGERLIKIGNKVGISAHSKCQALFEMAGAASTILTTIEAGGILDNDASMQNIMSSLNPPAAPSIQANYMSDFLTIINNWEKATGHNIKNPQANITGTVRVQSNGTKVSQSLN
ncbi:hypothetical protein [Dyadobacter sp. LHD-138]|uniref:hypothetical protein n=1 Tax=Dyadobacter sp. LHD-138 TaxID=3071413 RepID=UPI0027E062B6|nr:hypothetical protein [Dyadobacter sp. LHD-138]MDQ6477267.1 hypothetical protein [Dyadobacter sp. LHD-138]